MEKKKGEYEGRGLRRERGARGFREKQKKYKDRQRGGGGREGSGDRMKRLLEEIEIETQEVRKDVKGQGKEVREELAKMKEEMKRGKER